ncbi:uncharacterized protein LOC143202343 isoform X3 [Rhynchophorus ferrugineus]|uniref:uncharacterized protein LOC143202343 isoform X3 n=1 Tax=Rhynchophorus ferrugineus TaxID=354439 RepID=UPI003FCD7B7D
MKQIYDRYHVRHFCDTLNFPLSTYEQFSDGENNTMSPEYVQMEVDQNQNDIEGKLKDAYFHRSRPTTRVFKASIIDI